VNKGGTRMYLHTFSAMTVPLMSVPLVLTGFIAYFRRWQAGSGATFLMRLRDVHKYLSWLFIFVAIYGVASGINSYNTTRMQYYHLWVISPVLFLVPWAFMEYRHQVFMREHIQFVRPLTVITEEEFYTITRKGKRHLLLLDDLVLDATDYAPYHPGGKFIIERTRGTDVSKFFYGGYNLEPANNGENYNHTNYARLACNSLIIGKMHRSADICQVNIAGESNASADQLIKTFKFESIRGKALSSQIQRHFNIDNTGRHYLMQEVKDGKHVGNIRHYTVSNCLAEDQYTDYCRALESHVNVAKGRQEKIIRLDQSLYQLRPSTNFSLTLKAYWDAKGFSARMFQSSAANDGSEWMVKGPLGKSLGVKKSGQHIAFAAGTGAITFMDLSAYVARFVMGEMDENEAYQIADDFKFTYYVTYFNEEQSCGLRMLRLLKELNSKHFDLVVRLSSQRSARWDQNYLNSVLPPTCEKLWICGTPVMNDVFEAAFHNLAPKFPYLKDLEVVQVL
jgi:Cytochrome b5-like Heme/Steroid binding domain